MGKRKTERPPLIYSLKVENRDTGEALGYAADITTEGLRVISEESTAVTVQIPLRIHLPNNTMSRPPVDLLAEIRWCKPLADGKYAIGIHFLELSERGKSTVHELIRRFQAQPDESPDDPYLQDSDQWNILP